MKLDRWLGVAGAIGADPRESAEARLQRTLLVASTLMMASLGIL